MILAIDIGNTTVALGGIRDGRVCFVARMDTVRTRTAAEYRAEMDKIFAHRVHARHKAYTSVPDAPKGDGGVAYING